MGDPWGIVVVPAEGDPGGLLARGFNGTVQPIVYGTGVATWGKHLLHTRRHWIEALPLWWDGALVPEGWDRARRVVAAHEQQYREHRLWRSFSPGLGGVGRVNNALILLSLASRVVLLDLVDGRLVERQPSGPQPQQR